VNIGVSPCSVLLHSLDPVSGHLLLWAAATRREWAVEVEIYESDPFTAKKQDMLASFSSDYRFQKGDEIYIHQGGGRPLKVRLIDVRVHINSGKLSAELLALKL
jgi:hypothetical protein